MAAPRVLPTVTPAITGGGSGGTYDEILSPIYTTGLVLKNRSTANVFFLGNADPATAFVTLQPGQRVIVDGTARRLAGCASSLAGQPATSSSS